MENIVKPVEYLTIQHQEFINSHNETLAKIDSIENLTKEAIERELEISSLANNDLASYTGYHSIDNTDKGAFLAVDTVEWTLTAPLGLINFTLINIAASLDGETSGSVPFSYPSSFIKNRLLIPDVLDLTFSRAYNNGVLSTFNGKIGTTSVNGLSRFNPVPLATYAGEYFSSTATGSKPVLLVGDNGELKFDFGSGNGDLITVTEYAYYPAMFVLVFKENTSANTFVLMLGTSGTKGLVCDIEQEGSVNRSVTTFPSELKNPVHFYEL